MVPLLWAAHHGTKVLSSLFGGDLSDRLGRKRLIVSGWVLYAAVYAGFAFVSNTASLWILFLIYGIYFGLAEGAEKALVADLVRPEQRGTAYGLYNLAFGVTVFPASFLMGMIWDWKGPTVAFLVSAVMGATAAALLLLLVRRTQNQRQSPWKRIFAMRRRVLTPHPGLSTGIGYYLGGMEEVRLQVQVVVRTIPDDLIGKPAFLGAHSIGGLVLHIGEAEWFWMQMVVAGHQLTEEDKKAPYWDILDDVERVARNGYTTEFCFERDRLDSQSNARCAFLLQR